MIIPLRLRVRIGARRRDSCERGQNELRFVLFSNSLGCKNFIVFVGSGHRRSHLERLLNRYVKVN
jgi:hypothetical protein